MAAEVFPGAAPTAGRTTGACGTARPGVTKVISPTITMPCSPLWRASGSRPGDAKWFSENLQVHEPMLRAWLHSRFPNLVDVDDIVQQAYERMLTARQHRDIHSPKAFFFATARNLAYDHYRK